GEREYLVGRSTHVVDILEPPGGAGPLVFGRVAAIGLTENGDVEAVVASDLPDASRNVVRAERHPGRVGAVREPAVPARRPPQRSRPVAPDPDRDACLYRGRREGDA